MLALEKDLSEEVDWKASNPKLEVMTEKDIETVMAVEKESFKYYWSDAERFSEYIERLDAFVLRMGKDDVVGYLLITSKKDEMRIDKMAVPPRHRRKGLGSFIVRWVREFAAQQNIARIFLHVRESNRGAIHLYEQTGFKTLKKIDGYYKKTGETPDEKAAREMELLL